MQLSKEQEKIIRSTGNIKINAVAGSGKTTTVIEYAKSRPKNFHILYLVFNKSVKTEAQQRFEKEGLNNVQIETAHSIAYKHVVIPNQYRLKSNGYKTHEIAQLISGYSSTDKHAVYILANHVNRLISIFCNSDKAKVQDVNYADYIEDEQAQAFAKKYLEFIILETRQILAKMDKGLIEITHDFYLKKFQLQKKQLGYDLIMFDEGQDSSAVMLDIFLYQESQKLIVGDTHQQIYRWRNAINSLEKVNFITFTLSSSYRFNSDIARLASGILDWKSHFPAYKAIDIIGNGYHKTLKSKAIIARSNLGLLLKAIDFITENPKVKRLYFEGNFNSYTYADEGASLYDLLNLKNGKNHLIKDQLIGNMTDIEELEDYIEKTEDSQLSMMLEIVNEYGNEIHEIIQNIKSKHVSNEEKHTAEMIFSTVHRSKGMEYDEVLLVDDFINEDKIDKIIKSEADKDPSGKLIEEINLLYVAVTRTKNILHIPENLLPKNFPSLPSINIIKKTEIVQTFSKNKGNKKHDKYNNFNEQTFLNSGSKYQAQQSHQPWTPQLDNELIRLFKNGKSIHDLSKIFGRSKGAIWARVKKLDLGDYYSE